MPERRIEGMCPHCGWRYDVLLAHRNSGLVPAHKYPLGSKADCPGGNQNPRNPESDRRPLWKDMTPEKEEAMKFAAAPKSALDAMWPDERTEKCMLADCSLMESEYEPTSTGHDMSCHVKALLTRVRELESQAADHAVRAADMAAELKARREILNAVADVGGDGNCWMAAAEIDWRQRLRDFAEDREQHTIGRAEWHSNHGTFGLCLYSIGGFYVAYFDDAAEVWNQADDDRPMFHVMAKSGPPHRTVIHPLHLSAWCQHFAETCLPVTILTASDPE